MKTGTHTQVPPMTTRTVPLLHFKTRHKEMEAADRLRYDNYCVKMVVKFFGADNNTRTNLLHLSTDSRV